MGKEEKLEREKEEDLMRADIHEQTRAGLYYGMCAKGKCMMVAVCLDEKRRRKGE